MHRALGLHAKTVGQTAMKKSQPHYVCKAAKSDKTETSVTGIVFQPFREVGDMFKSTTEGGKLYDPAPEHSFARMHYHDTLEAAVNEQINVELNISYVYQSLSSYFYRDNVGLIGFGKYFNDESLEERSHAQKLIDFQNSRGGRVKLHPLVSPESEFSHAQKGDALYSMELALSLEKLNYDKLLHLRGVASKHGDAHATHWIEDNLLDDQIADIKQVSDWVSQLRRIGQDGHGVWHFDHKLYNGEVYYRTYDYANDGDSPN